MEKSAPEKIYINHIRKFIPITGEEEDRILQASELLRFKRNETVWQKGEICRRQYFPAKGSLALISTDDKGEEKVIQFAIETWWISDYDSMRTIKPSQFSLKAAEDSVVFALQNEVEEKLFEEIPALENYFRKVYQRAYAASLYRINLLYTQSKEQMFLNFREKYPWFLERIPQYMLASFLGFTPEYLSELRKKHP